MSRERIYIVEDERIIAIDLQRRLERLGYRVCGAAASGEEAIEGIRQHRPDLVLMDIVIQGEMDGIEVACAVKKEMDVPVIFLSAYTDQRTLERAKEASPLGYILKPFKERELATLLEMALYKSVVDSKVREKEQLFSAILNSTTDAILVIGRSTEIVFMNPEAEQILETSDSGARGRRFGELFSLSDMESGELFQMPRFSDQIKVLKARNLRLTNWKGNSFVVEMTINREMTASDRDENFIISFKDISRLHEMSDAIKYQSSHDALTGLLNRNELASRMNATLAKHLQSPSLVSAIFVDIDHFRLINDSCGTQAGDLLLKETAARVRSYVAGSGYAARTGGDDFVLVHCADPASPENTPERVAQRLVTETRNSPFRWGGKEFPVTLSVAIVPIDPLFKTEHDVMIAGNQTVITTHESGGNHYTVFARSDASGYGKTSIGEWITMIHDALINDRFRLYYQPIAPLVQKGHKPKIEILLRMVDPSGTIIQPGEFIPIAERYNIMPSIDRWVVKHAFETYARMRSAGNPLADSVFCVNLSGASLAEETIIAFIIDAAEEYRVPPSQFCIEVTETNAILNLTSASRFIYILKEQGFTFALDDFGSGFSSFNYLKNLPVDYLKIDGCFIRNMDRDQIDYTMVQAISSMCRVLGLSTIGEFAENETIIGMLREIGVDYAQGYGISRPIPLE